MPPYKSRIIVPNLRTVLRASLLTVLKALLGQLRQSTVACCSMNFSCNFLKVKSCQQYLYKAWSHTVPRMTCFRDCDESVKNDSFKDLSSDREELNSSVVPAISFSAFVFVENFQQGFTEVKRHFSSSKIVCRIS